VKRYILGMILISASIFGIILLFQYSLSEIASGKIPLEKVPQFMVQTITILLILVIPLMVGLILISIGIEKEELERYPKIRSRQV